MEMSMQDRPPFKSITEEPLINEKSTKKPSLESMKNFDQRQLESNATETIVNLF